MDGNAFGYVTELNRAMDGALAILEKLAEYPELDDEDFTVYQAYLREYVADANMMVLDALETSEQELMLRANRERIAWEKKIRDPDDCYLDVRRREKDLHQECKPSKLGLIFGVQQPTEEETTSAAFEDEDETELSTKKGLESDGQEMSEGEGDDND